MTAGAAIPFVRADGDPFECGYRHGAARAEALGHLVEGPGQVSDLAGPRFHETHAEVSARDAVRSFRRAA